MRPDPLRIAVFSNAYKPTISGVVTSLSLFRQGLMARGQHVHIIVPEVEGYEDDEPYVYRFPAFLDLTREFDVSLTLPLKRTMQHTIKGIKPHVIHSHHPHLLGDLAARYAEDLKVPLVFTFHARFDEFVRHQVPLFGDLASHVARGVVQDHLDHCSQIIVPTASIQQLVYEDYKVDVPVTILPTPIDLTRLGDLNPARIRRRYHLEGQQVLLYVGRMSPEKGLQFLIDSFARVAERNPKTLLVLVGRGPHVKSVQDHVQSLRIQDRVMFTGAAPHDQIPHFMAAADLFVFPSRAETQGLVLVEAMATGLPVVALHGTGSDDVLADTGAGVLAQPDEAAFAEAILRTLADPDRLATMGQAARRAAQRYSVAALTEQLLGVYERALLSGPHHR